VKDTTPEPVSGWAPIFSLLVVVLFAWGLWEAWDWGFRAGLFPWAVGFGGLALGLAQLDLDISGFLKKGVKALHTEVSSEAALEARRTASIVGWILGFFFAIWLLGFSWAILVATFLYLKVGAGEKWLITIILTLVAFGSFYGLFIHVLHVPFPDGLLFEWWAG
jgi:hypothetical protein